MPAITVTRRARRHRPPAPDAVAVGWRRRCWSGSPPRSGGPCSPRGTNLLLAVPAAAARSGLPHVGRARRSRSPSRPWSSLRGPELAGRLRWRAAARGRRTPPRPPGSLALALVDGWQRGVVERLTSTEEYLHDVPRVTDIPAMLATFADHILDRPARLLDHPRRRATRPGRCCCSSGWTGSGSAAAARPGSSVILVGASAAVAVAVTLRALGAEDVARRGAAVRGAAARARCGSGVSADGLFAGVLAWGSPCWPLRRDRPRPAADLARWPAGCCSAAACTCPTGWSSPGCSPLAVLVADPALGGPRVLAAAGVAAVVLALHRGRASGGSPASPGCAVIYAASIAADRPYAYFVWANLAALLVAARARPWWPGCAGAARPSAGAAGGRRWRWPRPALAGGRWSPTSPG